MTQNNEGCKVVAMFLTLLLFAMKKCLHLFFFFSFLSGEYFQQTIYFTKKPHEGKYILI